MTVGDAWKESKEANIISEENKQKRKLNEKLKKILQREKQKGQNKKQTTAF